jgi:hypothetical protein
MRSKYETPKIPTDKERITRLEERMSSVAARILALSMALEVTFIELAFIEPTTAQRLLASLRVSLKQYQILNAHAHGIEELRKLIEFLEKRSHSDGAPPIKTSSPRRRS